MVTSFVVDAELIEQEREVLMRFREMKIDRQGILVEVDCTLNIGRLMPDLT
jgi:hypothetical protein